MIDLSIAICAYNAATRLPATLTAVANQQVSDRWQWETVVIDNASRDETSKVAESFSDRIPNLRVIRETQPGLVYARQRAAREVRGRLTSFVDDDNLIAPDWVEQCIAFMDAHPRAGLVGGRIDALFEDPNSRPHDFDERYRDGLAIRDFGNEPKLLTAPQVDPPPGAGLTGRTELVRQLLLEIGCQLVGHSGGKLTNGEDTEMGLIAQRLGWETWYTPKLRVDHVLPPVRLTETYLQKLIADGAQSAPWLDYLRGKAPQRTRAGYLLQWARWWLVALRMDLMGLLRRNHPHTPLYSFWARFNRSTAAGNLSLARQYPFEALQAKLDRLRVHHGNNGGANE